MDAVPNVIICNAAALVFILLIIGNNCTNYSSSDAVQVNIPIITLISKNGTGGHLIEMAAQNAEVGFAGYRVFQGATEQVVQTAAPETGTDCSLPLYVLPTQGIPYRIEVDPLAGPPLVNTLNIVCTVHVSLTAGNYTAVRPLIYSNFYTITTGLSSNAVIVP
jgi:hypothetical protein